MTDKLFVLRRERYNWSDPWGREYDEPVDRVVAILRPETDPSIQRFEFQIDPGYGPTNVVPSYGYKIPGIGEVRHMVDVVSGMGSWWSIKGDGGSGLVIHDSHTIRHDRKRKLDMWGRPWIPS